MLKIFRCYTKPNLYKYNSIQFIQPIHIEEVIKIVVAFNLLLFQFIVILQGINYSNINCDINSEIYNNLENLLLNKM